MPPWLAILLGLIGGFVSIAAVGKTLLALAKLITTMDRLNAQFAEHPEFFATLAGIAAEFNPNSGHSLRDSIDRLEDESAECKRTSAQTLSIVQEIKAAT